MNGKSSGLAGNSIGGGVVGGPGVCGTPGVLGEVENEVLRQPVDVHRNQVQGILPLLRKAKVSMLHDVLS